MLAGPQSWLQVHIESIVFGLLQSLRKMTGKEGEIKEAQIFLISHFSGSDEFMF